jgi:ABC-type glycerol-3-phosphate transport system substrate-binding protein
MWNDFGLEPPDTWEEFVETIKKMDVYKNGRLETAGAQFDHWTIDTLIGWSTLLWANGGRYLTEDMKEAAFNSPEGLKATQMYLDLTHPELGEDAFILELAATSYNGPWARSHYRDVAPYLNYKALPPLKGADGEPIAMAYSWLWCVNAGISEEKKLEAWKFLQWLTSAEEYLWMALEAGFVPIRKDNAEDPRVKNDEWLSTFAYALNYGRKYPEHPNWPEIQEAIYKQLQRVFVREISAEEGLRLAEQDVNRILGN